MERYLLHLQNKWKHNFIVDTRKDGSFSFLHKQVLFVGLNVIGEFEKDMFEQRMKENLSYTTSLLLKHANDIYACVLFFHKKQEHQNRLFFYPFSSFVKNHPEISFLYLHGHGHNFLQKLKGENVMRVQVDQ